MMEPLPVGFGSLDDLLAELVSDPDNAEGFAAASRELEREKQGAVMAEPISARLDDLAHRVSRLSPSRTDPERFLLEKDEISRELRYLARHGDHGFRKAARGPMDPA